jgi:hypothetical protein
MNRGLLAIAATFVAGLAPASAASAASTYGLTAEGDPRLTFPTTALASEFQTWWTCRPDQACSTTAYTGGELLPGPVPRGTSFVADGSFTQTPVAVRSPLWQGRVAAVTPPSLAGSATPGGTVRAVPAGWSGGWGDEASTAVVLACPAATRTDCEYLADSQGRTSGTVERTVYAKHVGWSLYAVEYRTAREDPAPMFVHGPGVRPAASALVAVSAPVTVKVEEPSFEVTLEDRVAGTRTGVTVGRVRCAARCVVELAVGKERRKRTVRRSATLRIPRRLAAGRYAVSVKIDGEAAASGRVRVSR